jgi:Fur family iron response transcriptional regulator
MPLLTQLQTAGLRATPKRIAIGGLLFDGVDRHVTADDVADMARKAGIKVSLATVYNTLNQFVAAGILKRIILDTDRTYFDTNVSDHHHLFYETSGDLLDVPGDSLRIEGLPAVPEGARVRAVEVVIRMSGTPVSSGSTAG